MKKIIMISGVALLSMVVLYRYSRGVMGPSSGGQNVCSGAIACSNVDPMNRADCTWKAAQISDDELECRIEGWKQHCENTEARCIEDCEFFTEDELCEQRCRDGKQECIDYYSKMPPEQPGCTIRARQRCQSLPGEYGKK